MDMKTQSALRAFIVTALGMALVSGCSLFGDGPKWGAKRNAEKAAKALPSLPEPVPTHRFEIDAATDLPLYALLRNVDVHVTECSSVVIEAEAFRVSAERARKRGGRR